ncbi:MAG TPA: ligase-associated DNA damage response endonuclease PdeM [Caulobacteraceae bacterium]|nr:ligase-associated DNA damage response endonuclease PdeM [Caulobacteraceae bacterium]
MNALAAACAPAGVRITLNGVDVLCRPSGSLWIADERALVAADLHLEKGSCFAARGQFLPPYDSAETLGRLEAEAAALGAARLVLLGDSFHDVGAFARAGPALAARLAALAERHALLWILGNHDPELPPDVPGKRLAACSLAGLKLTHEPLGRPSPGEVAGHLHPCVRVGGGAASVRRRCFATDGERMVLPAFGAYAGGLNVLDRAFRGLFRRPPCAIALGGERAHLVGWRSLRPD